MEHDLITDVFNIYAKYYPTPLFFFGIIEKKNRRKKVFNAHHANTKWFTMFWKYHMSKRSQN